MKRKIILVVVAITIAVTMLMGCGNDKNSTASVSDKSVVKISMLYADNATYPLKKDWLVLDEIKKMAKVDLDIQVVSDADYFTKMNVLMSSGKIPDIITNVYSEQINDFALGGLLLPISDYSDKFCNYTKKVSEWKLESDINKLKESDGKLYLLPGFMEFNEQSFQLGIRKDLLKDYGLKDPETYDDLYNILKAAKAKNPAMLGISDKYKGDLLLCVIARSFGTNGGWSMPHGYTYNYDSQKWYFAPTSDNYKMMLKYLNKLYKEGLLDPETFTQDSKQFQQKLYNGQVMSAAMSQGESLLYSQQIAANTNKSEAMFKPILPLAGPSGLRLTKSSSRIRQGVAISNSSKNKPYFNRLLEFVDWLYYSEEGINLTNWGVNGGTYNIVDGKKAYIPEIKCEKNKDGTVLPTVGYGLTTNSLTAVMNTELLNYKKSSEEVTFNKQLNDEKLIPLDDPILKFNSSEIEKASLYESTLKSYYKEMTLKFIFGQADLDKDWDEYVNQCNQKRLPEFMQLIDTVWQRQSNK